MSNQHLDPRPFTFEVLLSKYVGQCLSHIKGSDHGTINSLKDLIMEMESWLVLDMYQVSESDAQIVRDQIARLYRVYEEAAKTAPQCGA